MREQVISHKVGNRTGISGQKRSGSVMQKPARRESNGEAVASKLRSLLGYMPTVLKLALAIVLGVVFFAGYRAAASASLFQVQRVEVQGTSRVSAQEVKGIVQREAEQTGVWNADLRGISNRLERLAWVRSVTVSRVLPDGIRVRVTERVPQAVVRTASGRFRWVDDEAVLLGEMLPTDQIPSFFMRGLSEEDSDVARKENQERVQKFLELQREWDTAGLSERVSEVNLSDLRDVRAQLAGDSSQIEVRLGSQDHGKRLKKALDVLDSQRQTPRGSMISYIDLNQGNRAIVGLVSGVHTTSDGAPVNAPPAADTTVENKSERPAPENTARARTSSVSTKPADVKNRKRDEKKESEKKSDKAKNANRRG